jgi:hypothetical protein
VAETSRKRASVQPQVFRGNGNENGVSLILCKDSDALKGSSSIERRY